MEDFGIPEDGYHEYKAAQLKKDEFNSKMAEALSYLPLLCKPAMRAVGVQFPTYYQWHDLLLPNGYTKFDQPIEPTQGEFLAKDLAGMSSGQTLLLVNTRSYRFVKHSEDT